MAAIDTKSAEKAADNSPVTPTNPSDLSGGASNITSTTTTTTTTNNTNTTTPNTAGSDDKSKPLHPNDGGDGTHTPERTHIDEELLKPLWIANLIHDRPCAMCWCIIFFMFGLGAIDATVFALSDTSQRTWFVEEDSVVEDYDSFTLAEEELSNHGGSDFETDPQTEEASFLTVYWMFELDSYANDLDTNDPSATDYWILTPENVETIIKYEDMILNDDEFSNYYCYVIDTSTYDCNYTSMARRAAENWNYDYDS